MKPPTYPQSIIKLTIAAAVVGAAGVANADRFAYPFNTGNTASSICYGPVNVSSTDFDQIETGNVHTVARLGGTIYTWGLNNDLKQLGRNGAVNTPTAVTSFEDGKGKTIPAPVITKVVAGDTFGLAIDENGHLYQWGQIAGNVQYARPHRQDQLPWQVLDLAAGGGHALLRVEVGSHEQLRGFGDNTYGEAGNLSGSPISSANSQLLLSSIFPDIKNIACGDDHSIVSLKSGYVYSFGRNTNGQLGDGTTYDHNTDLDHFVLATRADGSPLTGIDTVAAGNGYSVVSDASGEVFTVGNNSGGQLGRSGDFTRFGSTGLYGASTISAGYNYAVAKNAVGDLFEWGFRATGDSSFSTIAVPTQVFGYHNIGAVEAGSMVVSTPFDSTYFNNSGGVSQFNAIADPVPTYVKTELYTSAGDRAGLTYYGGQGGWVRIYTDIPASHGNGPVFNAQTTSTKITFGGSAQVPDGATYVDIPVGTVPVSQLEDSRFDVWQNGHLAAAGKIIRVWPPVADSLTIQNLNGTIFTTGSQIRLSVTMPFPAPAEGYQIQFTSSNQAVLADGTINVAGGATSGSVDVTLPTINALSQVTVTAVNVVGMNRIARFTVKK
jgi:hypothetical protein